MQLTEYKYPNFSVSQIGSVFHFNQTRLIYHGSHVNDHFQFMLIYRVFENFDGNSGNLVLASVLTFDDC